MIDIHQLQAIAAATVVLLVFNLAMLLSIVWYRKTNRC